MLCDVLASSPSSKCRKINKFKAEQVDFVIFKNFYRRLMQM